MNIRTFDSLLERIRDPDILRSGRELYLNDAVRLTKVQSDGLLANVLSARPCTVALHRTGSQAEFRCSCAAGRNGCEHVAAVLFELKRRAGAHLDLAPDVTVPSAAKEAAQRGPRRPKWAKSVARLLGTKAEIPQKRNDHRGLWRLAFVLSVYGERRAVSPLRISTLRDAISQRSSFGMSGLPFRILPDITPPIIADLFRIASHETQLQTIAVLWESPTETKRAKDSLSKSLAFRKLYGGGEGS